MLAVGSIFVIMIAGVGIGYYQFVVLPGLDGEGCAPLSERLPAEEVVQVGIVEGSVDPTNGDFYVPQELTVVLGINHTIVWTNEDPGILHTVTARDKGTDFSEEALPDNYIDPGMGWAFTFCQPGDYYYKCTPHPHMRAVIHILPIPDESSATENEVLN